jgi:regulatory protein
VQEEDSSSPNDSLKLLQVNRTGSVGERIELRFSDGSCFFVSDSDLWEQGISTADLAPPLELSADVVQRLKHSSIFRQIREKALDLLARAPHTSFSLRMKLLKRNFDSQAIDEVLQLLKREGYLDDESFAENWLRSRIERRAEGRVVLIAGLLRKGVAWETAEEAVNRCLPPALERENALRALEKLEGSGETDPAVLRRKLRARGFPFPLIRQVVEGRGKE